MCVSECGGVYMCVCVQVSVCVHVVCVFTSSQREALCEYHIRRAFYGKHCQFTTYTETQNSLFRRRRESWCVMCVMSVMCVDEFGCV